LIMRTKIALLPLLLSVLLTSCHPGIPTSTEEILTGRSSQAVKMRMQIRTLFRAHPLVI
jgi:hypothetical protein